MFFFRCVDVFVVALLIISFCSANVFWCVNVFPLLFERFSFAFLMFFISSANAFLLCHVCLLTIGVGDFLIQPLPPKSQMR